MENDALIYYIIFWFFLVKNLKKKNTEKCEGASGGARMRARAEDKIERYRISFVIQNSNQIKITFTYYFYIIYKWIERMLLSIYILASGDRICQKWIVRCEFQIYRLKFRI